MTVWTKTKHRIDNAPLGTHSIFEVAIDETEFDIAVESRSTVAEGCYQETSGTPLYHFTVRKTVAGHKLKKLGDLRLICR